AALVASGFERVGAFDDDYYYEGLHHLRPLRLPDHPVPVIEIHRRLSWVNWLEPPRAEELFSVAVPAACGVPGLLGLPPGAHALVLASHSWGERPLRRLLDIIDVAAVAAADSRDGANTLAARWGLSRMWKTTLAAANAVLFDERTPWSLRMWARDLPSARDRSVFEDHLRRWLSPFWALPPHRAVAAALQALVEEVSPASNETWGNKLGRVREALLNPWRPSAEHAGRLGREGVQPRHRRR